VRKHERRLRLKPLFITWNNFSTTYHEGLSIPLLAANDARDMTAICSTRRRPTITRERLQTLSPALTKCRVRWEAVPACWRT
jgi:hypothetical protein